MNHLSIGALSALLCTIRPDGEMKRRQALHATGCVLIAAVVTLSAGCSSRQKRVVMQGAQAFPGHSLQDWVTYGDVAVRFRIAAEREIPPTEEETERGEGTITRMVTAERRGNPIWSRPSRGEDAPAMPARWDIASGGWIFHGDERTPLFQGDYANLAVGQEYVTVQAYSTYFTPGGEWMALVFLPIQGGVVTRPNESPNKPPGGAAAVAGKSAAEVADTMRATKPDARAATYMDLDVCARWQKVAENSHGPQELGPGEKPD